MEVLDHADWTAEVNFGTKIWNQTAPNVQVVAQAIEKLGEPSRDRTEDPLIKSESTDPRTTMHGELSARESEGW